MWKCLKVYCKGTRFVKSPFTYNPGRTYCRFKEKPAALCCRFVVHKTILSNPVFFGNLAQTMQGDANGILFTLVEFFPAPFGFVSVGVPSEV